MTEPLHGIVVRCIGDAGAMDAWQEKTGLRRGQELSVNMADEGGVYTPCCNALSEPVIAIKKLAPKCGYVTCPNCQWTFKVHEIGEGLAKVEV